jgi:hypothetical protein
MWLFLGLGAMLAGGLVLHERAKAGTVAAPIVAPSTFDGVETGHLYRVWAKLVTGYGANAPIADLEADLSNKVRALGFSEVLLANEDPTDAHVWTFLTRWGGVGHGGTNVPPLAIYSLEEVQEPPPPELFPEPSPVLDVDLSFAESNAVNVALQKEIDPAKLFNFAKAMALDFPVSQSLLKAKAGILIKPVTPQSTAAFHAVELGAQAPITNVMAPPMAKAALLDYRAKAETA